MLNLLVLSTHIHWNAHVSGSFPIADIHYCKEQLRFYCMTLYYGTILKSPIVMHTKFLALLVLSTSGQNLKPSKNIHSPKSIVFTSDLSFSVASSSFHWLYLYLPYTFLVILIFSWQYLYFHGLYYLYFLLNGAKCFKSHLFHWINITMLNLNFPTTSQFQELP